MPDPDAPVAKRRRLSLELKLPLVTSALLLAVLAIYTWIGYKEVAQAARSAVSERNSRLAAELARLSATSSAARARLTARIANRPAVQQALVTRSFDGVASELDSLHLPTDSVFQVVLFTTDREPAFFIGGAPDAELLSRAPPLFAEAQRRDTMSVSSPLFDYRGQAHVWNVAAVRTNGATVGYVAHLRRITTNPAAMSTLQGLIGEGNRILFANIDQPRAPWVVLDGTTLPAPRTELDDHDGWRYRRASGWYLAGRQDVAGTPFRVIVETPAEQAQTRPLQYLRRTGLLGLLLLLGAAALVWIGSRRITRPIRQLNAATGAIERGKLQERVEINRADELGELGRSFNQMAAEVQRAMLSAEESRAEAQQANRTKSEFLANMSHEIRTPINAILGYTDLIDYGVAGDVSEQQRAHLERIRVSGNHLIGLIDDLLDFARLDVASLNVQQRDVPAGDSIKTALTVINPQANDKSLAIHVACEQDARYIGDPQRVEQILVNLLGNAIKFTAAGGSIRLDCHTTRSNGTDTTEFIVTDTGVGIPADRLEAIFEPFIQAKGGYTRPHGGTGLGLSISRRLAELMQGSISVESTVGEGSRFTLKMPAAAD